MKNLNNSYKHLYLDDEAQKNLLIQEETKAFILINFYDKTNKNSSLNIRVKKNQNIKIIDIYINTRTSSNSKKINFILEDNAKVDYYKIQNLLFESSLKINFTYSLEENSNLNINFFEFETLESENIIEGNLVSNNSSLFVNALVKIGNNSFHTNTINTTHKNTNTHSDINFKNILNDKTKTIFAAKTIVEKNALFSTAYQNVNTILLSNDATVLAQPHLEILTQELKATHGATTGSLDKEQLSYLLHRGIKEEDGKKLLLKAFELEIYDKISDQNIKELIQNFNRNDYV